MAMALTRSKSPILKGHITVFFDDYGVSANKI